MGYYQQHARGFSYIEILLSLAIASVLLTLFYTVIAVGPANAFEDNRSKALSVARYEIESLRTLPFESLPASGPQTPEGIAQLPDGTADLSVTDVSPGVRALTITVSWRESTGERFSTGLTTLSTDIP